MWNEEEDNNPYGSFDRRDSNSSDLPNAASIHFDRPQTPPSPSASTPPAQATPARYSDDEDDFADQRPARKKGGYDSRIEQILYENPELQIIITDAGKSSEGGGGFIVYTIRTGDLEVRRRYSEFASLRDTLVRLHPTLVIPPIPEKHTMADYAAKPTKAKEDQAIIELRKRMLMSFLNRCRKMQEVREDGVWWRFLDPNASWNEVVHSHPIALIPKNNLKAPPLDPSNPSNGHQYLPVPSSSAKLRSSSIATGTGTPAVPAERATLPSTAAHTAPGQQVFTRFPPSSANLSEEELDPYFSAFESSTKDLENLLQGQIDRANRRFISHLIGLAGDQAELGGRYNAFSLSEPSPTLATAIERVGQAVDSSYLATEELSTTLSATFAEPMRESAQFASVVRAVLRFRILKRVQQEMTRDELVKKRSLLESLEASERESKRLNTHLVDSGYLPPRENHGRSRSTSSVASDAGDDRFPPTHADDPPSGRPSGEYGSASEPAGEYGSSPTTSPNKSRSFSGGGSVREKIFGRISHAIHGVVDTDPERTRRDQIGKTRDSLEHLGQALEVSEKDVRDASAGVLKDLKRFQRQKEEDLRRYMISYGRCHIDWARKNLENWSEAAKEVEKIQLHAD